eukprot:TRINITY_DN4036_c0_g1_i1.p1 TRINITY_DN4036_c0_g1~~TRINITY_DN4036_c0_g1_i1.p1  ORF type:complete len:1167 (+),score=288.35 TRINITY_DN4036_c0_g1_i1:375-3503(+)
MSSGVFVQHTIEGVLLDVEGRQLMCEALYLYGVMLLLLDSRIPGYIRERMIVCYFRYKSGTLPVEELDNVVRLCRDNHFVPGGKRPTNYPEEYFARFKVPRDVVIMIIGRLQADDIYNHTSAFPAPEHRSIALGTQAAMLYVILYFAPDILHKKESHMREICDKFFCDNWVVPFYLGFTIDLEEAWSPYSAARTALSNIVNKTHVNELVTKHSSALDKLSDELDKLLTQGVLTEELLLSNVQKLMHCVRCCNSSLRWCFLHRACVNKKFREVVCTIAPDTKLMKVLLNTAQFEFKLKSLFKQLLDSKQVKWEESKKQCQERMMELSTYFSGTQQLARVKKDDNLTSWFKQLGEEIGSLDFNSSLVAGRKVALLTQVLEDVKEFHQIETNALVKEFITETRQHLQAMLRSVNITPKMMADLDIISDFSFAWSVIHSYTPLLHDRIRKKPSLVLLLRASFLKLSSILSLPLVRITQAGSKDDVSVADYFSSELVRYVRGVLEVIPQSVFATLDTIIDLLTHKLKPVETKVERKLLNNASQLEQRYELAKATHGVSVFSEGILAMETTLMGIIKLDPKQLLEDGIRKELVRQIARSLHEHLIFKTGKMEEFEEKLCVLTQKLNGFRQSFEYIQDYINMYGLKIWQEEFSRIINYYVEQESNQFLKKKILDWQSDYQSDAIPIPQFAPITSSSSSSNSRDPRSYSLNAMGRLVRELIRQTDARTTVYVDGLQGWYDEKNREVVGIRTFFLLHRSLGVFGLTGLDRLISFMIVKDLTDFVRLFRKTLSQTANVRSFLSKLSHELHPTSQFPPNTNSIYEAALQKTQKLWPNFLEYVVRIGQMQLLRRQIANELNFSCKSDSKLLSCALDVMNKALLNDLKAHYAKPEQRPYPGNELISELSAFLETAGISSPITKIYITTEPLEGIPVLMFLFVLAQLTALQWKKNISTLVCANRAVPLDGGPLVVGVITLLKQFHSSHVHTFLAYLGQYVRASISVQATSSTKTNGLPPMVVNVLLFLEEFCRFSGVSRKALDSLVPSYIFDRFDH